MRGFMFLAGFLIAISIKVEFNDPSFSDILGTGMLYLIAFAMMAFPIIWKS
jgi:hypothetical protein